MSDTVISLLIFSMLALLTLIAAGGFYLVVGVLREAEKARAGQMTQSAYHALSGDLQKLTDRLGQAETKLEVQRPLRFTGRNQVAVIRNDERGVEVLVHDWGAEQGDMRFRWTIWRTDNDVLSPNEDEAPIFLSNAPTLFDAVLDSKRWLDNHPAGAK